MTIISGAPVATAPAPESAADRDTHPSGLFVYFVIGIFFGIVLTKSEVISWFRIQEMFRFQALHMYGIFASALAVAVPLILLIKRHHVRTLGGEPIAIPPKQMGNGSRYAIGGLTFGLGWALIGACPGPIFALIGSGVGVMVVALLSALAGTWVYGYLRPRLPH
jgi:uncharacterized membrane protein YedE/YeeE